METSSSTEATEESLHQYDGDGMLMSREEFEKHAENDREYIVNFLRKFSLHDEDADDLCQRTFLQAFQKLHLLKHPDQFRSWVCAIARMEALMFFRRKRRHPLVSLEVFRGDDQESFEDRLSVRAKESDLVTQSTDAERTQIVRLLVSNLRPKQRAAIEAFHFNDKKIHEIANDDDNNENTIKTRLLSGRAQLRTLIIEQYPDLLPCG